MINILVCTVGTSLFKPNMMGLKQRLDDGIVEDLYRPAAEAYSRSNYSVLGRALFELDGQNRTCGAEINSIDSMFRLEQINQETKLFFLHSDTDFGRDIAQVLSSYYGKRSESRQIDGLQDANPREFRTKGLRNLAKQMCKILIDNKYAKCGINATGGYKAQIAVATILGQALGVPVYYKHEYFDDVIEFPPMPVALDYELWMRTSGLLFDLSRTSDCIPQEDYREILDGDERVESFIERVHIDGQNYIEISPVGVIFQETFKDRFKSEQDQVLPPPVMRSQKAASVWEDSGSMRSHPEIMDRMNNITSELAFVKRCYTWYFNPDLSSRNYFRIGSKGIEGIISDGTYTAKFGVDTSAITDGQKNAAVAALNAWLENAKQA